MVTLREVWRKGAEILRRAGVERPLLDAEILLRHLTGWSREQFYRELPAPWAKELEPEWMEILNRRAQGTPVAYLVGQKEFFGLKLKVTPAVLVPRPETELVVERALELVQTDLLGAKTRVLDLGTGSGAIALALAANLPQIRVLGTDWAPAALELARANAHYHNLDSRVEFCRADLWPAAGTFQLVVSNPPYIPSSKLKELSPEVQSEPALALDGGPDGLAYYRRIAAGLDKYLAPAGWVLLEVGAGQAEEVGRLLTAAGLTVLPPRADLAGRPRLVQAHL